MKLKTFILITFLSFTSTYAQKYFTKTGITEFKASVKAFEPVEAINKSTTSIIDAESGKMACLLFVNAFHFEIALMQEHFNENYMDSHKYPKATFKGKINDFDTSKLTNEFTSFNLTGILSVKGKDKKISTKIQLKLDPNKWIAKGYFNVKPKDFDIKIPSIVSKKIADNIQIQFNYEMVKK